MKKLFTHIAVLIAFALVLNVNVSAQKSLSNGPSVVQIGVGLGGYYDGGATGQTPYLVGTFQKTILENVGPGDVSVGGTVNFKSLSYQTLAADWGMKYFAVGGRANWHPHFIKIDKLDAYTGIMLGFEAARVKFRSEAYTDLATNASGMAIGFHIGARYQINDKFGAWMEIGAGQGILNFGASYSL